MSACVSLSLSLSLSLSFKFCFGRFVFLSSDGSGTLIKTNIMGFSLHSTNGFFSLFFPGMCSGLILER